MTRTAVGPASSSAVSATSRSCQIAEAIGSYRRIAEPALALGAVRMIAIAEEKRSSVVPQLPTNSETLPGIVHEGWYGLLAFIVSSWIIAIATRLSDATPQDRRSSSRYRIPSSQRR